MLASHRTKYVYLDCDEIFAAAKSQPGRLFKGGHTTFFLLRMDTHKKFVVLHKIYLIWNSIFPSLLINLCLAIKYNNFKDKSHYSKTPSGG